MQVTSRRAKFEDKEESLAANIYRGSKEATPKEIPVTQKLPIPSRQNTTCLYKSPLNKNLFCSREIDSVKKRFGEGLLIRAAGASRL